MSIKTTLQEITPSKAQDFLSKNTNNRNIKDHVVNKYKDSNYYIKPLILGILNKEYIILEL